MDNRILKLVINIHEKIDDLRNNKDPGLDQYCQYLINSHYITLDKITDLFPEINNHETWVKYILLPNSKELDL